MVDHEAVRDDLLQVGFLDCRVLLLQDLLGNTPLGHNERQLVLLHGQALQRLRGLRV